MTTKAGENWSYLWGCTLSVDKKKSCLFTWERETKAQVFLNGRQIKRAKVEQFLGVWFDVRLTWM